jgi:hypothetical protein
MNEPGRRDAQQDLTTDGTDEEIENMILILTRVHPCYPWLHFLFDVSVVNHPD